MATSREYQGLDAVIFDLDGTILDTMVQWNSLGIEYLKARGITPDAGLLDKVGTMSLRESAAYFREEYGVELSTEEILAEMRDILTTLYAKNARAKPGALDTLRFLKDRGVKLVLATATSNELASAGLRLVGALDYFDRVFSCRDPEIHASKGHSKIFDVALAFLGASKARTVVVEDALYAVQTAKEAGYRVVAIEDESERTRRTRIQSLADAYVRNHEELQNFFKLCLASEK